MNLDENFESVDRGIDNLAAGMLSGIHNGCASRLFLMLGGSMALPMDTLSRLSTTCRLLRSLSTFFPGFT